MNIADVSIQVSFDILGGYVPDKSQTVNTETAISDPKWVDLGYN
jgi:hypothetical protein